MFVQQNIGQNKTGHDADTRHARDSVGILMLSPFRLTVQNHLCKEVFPDLVAVDVEEGAPGDDVLLGYAIPPGHLAAESILGDAEGPGEHDLAAVFLDDAPTEFVPFKLFYRDDITHHVLSLAKYDLPQGLVLALPRISPGTFRTPCGPSCASR